MKLFDNKSLSKRELRKIICVFAKTQGVIRVTYNNKNKQVSGTYNAENKTIFIGTKLTKYELLSTFFHELAHHTAVKKKKWLKYHFDPACPSISSIRKFYIENNIDKMAKTLWNKYVDLRVWGKYKYGYPKTEKKMLTRWLSNQF